MLGLGGTGKRKDVEDDRERDTELRDDHLLGITGIFSAPNPDGIFKGRVDPVWQKL